RHRRHVPGTARRSHVAGFPRAHRRHPGLLHVRRRRRHRDALLNMAKLYFYYSTMNAGKSTALLQASHNYEERGMRTLLYTASVDSRAGGRIHSRIGIQREARHFHPALDLRKDVGAAHAESALACVLVDEAQFLTPAQ